MIAALLFLVAQDGPIVVRSRWLDPPPHFANQSIGVEVTASNGGEGSSIIAPRTTGATLVPGPLEANSGGSLVATFRLTADHAGSVQVPPFTARQAGTDRVGRGGSLSTTIRELPANGRIRAFLGGIGTLEAVEAEAVPAEIRVGESFEYRLRIVGKAAAGSVQVPDFSGWGRLPLGLRVDPPNSEMAGDSERVVTARVRATAAGEADLPAIPVAAFDPVAQVYRTWRGPRVAIQVIEAPAFDPGVVAYGPTTTPPPSTPPRRRQFPWISIVLAPVLGLASFGLGWLWLRAKRDPRRFASRVPRSLNRIDDSSILASRIETALVVYLKLAAGRPTGALTPSEAREWVGGFTDDPELADHALRVVESADRALYSGHQEACEPLRDDAVALFRALSRPKNHGDRRHK